MLRLQGNVTSKLDKNGVRVKGTKEAVAGPKLFLTGCGERLAKPDL